MESEEKSLSKNVLPEDYLEISIEKTIKNLPSLIEALRSMDNEVFSHYVSKSHNKIADWIEEGYDNKKLSRKVRKILSKDKLIRSLEKELKKDKKIMEKMNNKKSRKIIIPKRKKDILEELSKLDNKILN